MEPARGQLVVFLNVQLRGRSEPHSRRGRHRDQYLKPRGWGGLLKKTSMKLKLGEGVFHHAPGWGHLSISTSSRGLEELPRGKEEAEQAWRALESRDHGSQRKVSEGRWGPFNPVVHRSGRSRTVERPKLL